MTFPPRLPHLTPLAPTAPVLRLAPTVDDAPQLFVWPLTSFLWAFDINGVAQRSLACDWIRSCTSHDECESVIAQKRSATSGSGSERVAVRSREVLPQWSDDECKIVFSDWHESSAATAKLSAMKGSETGAGQRHGKKDSSCGQQ